MTYTESDWEKEMSLNKFCGRHPNWFYSGCTIPCPSCKSVGLYGPKLSVDETTKEINRIYRACKFCGWWQDVGGEPYFCIPIHCKSCNIYDWTQPKEEKDFKSCPKCGVKYVKTKPPSDDQNHPARIRKGQMDSIHGINE